MQLIASIVIIGSEKISIVMIELSSDGCRGGVPLCGGREARREPERGSVGERGHRERQKMCAEKFSN